MPAAAARVLACQATRPVTGAAAGRLGLSAAHFGRDGLSDARGRMSAAEAAAVLQVAVEAGVGVLDTAAARGEAEALMGLAMPRPCPFKLIVRTAPVANGVDAVESHARASLLRLGLDHGEALLVHCASDLLGPHGAALWNRMKRLRDEGLFQRIGVSAAPEDDPVGLARRFKPDLMQLPVSLLDQRLVHDGSLQEIAGLSVDIHLRSIFLHGLLFLPRHGLPPGMAAAGPRLSRIRRMIAEAGADPLQAALAFALGRDEASGVVVGAASAAELRAIVAAAAAPAPVLEWDALALDQVVALDPQQWAAA